MTKRLFRNIGVIFTAGVLLVSCATQVAYYQNMDSLIASGKYVDAEKLIEQSKESVYGNKNALLYYLDLGMMRHVDGEYKESNEAFEKAKRLFDELFTKSITTEATTFLISDNTRPYYGEDFERAQVNIFCALNYLMLGNGMDALVEARQVDDFLKKLNTDYGRKDVYKQDAFARYLTGLIYEDQGQINDAFISYKQSLSAYKEYVKYYGLGAPKELIGDALRTAKMLGFNDEFQYIKNDWKGSEEINIPRDSGELVIIDYNGLSAEKVDSIFEIAFGKAWGYVGAVQPQGKDQVEVDQAGAVARGLVFDEQVRIAFPKYQRIHSRIEGFRASPQDLSGENSSNEVVQDVSAIAIKNLQDRIARIRIKAIARAAVKFALAHKISDQVEQSSGSQILGWIAKKALTTAATVTETADKRSWRSLPDKILMARLTLKEGSHSINLKFYDSGGSVVDEKTLDNISIKAGRKTFAIVRTAY